MTTETDINTLRDLLDRLGGIPLSRVRFHPAPGMATEQDVIAADAHEDRLCELVDGVLVEKAMGFREALLAGALVSMLRAFVVPRKLGVITGADGMLNLFPGVVRIPDVAFVSKERLPGGRVPREAIPLLSPDLAVEVLSESNTKAEMIRKRGEYFDSGSRLVWEVDPGDRIVTVYTSANESVVLGEEQTLDGGDVLPGFSLPLKTLFAELDQTL